MPTLGSSGDVHPVIALALALRARGHRATILTNPLFQSLIETLGLGFLPVGSVEAAEAAIADPDLWHAHRGFGVVARRVIVPAIAPIYRHIELHAAANTVVAASGICLGARVAAERLGIPTATVHLQPTIIRSLIEHGMVGTVRVGASQPMWFKRTLFRLLDWTLLDRYLSAPLNAFRANLGLSPVRRVLWRWIHSPQCVIGFFPPWFAPPQRDWPPHTHLVGFPLWDGGDGQLPVSPEAQEFIDKGAAPVVFTPGSAASTMQLFFKESIAAAQRLGVRAMLVTNFPEQLPSQLPAGIQAFGYLPFSQVLPRAALLVYHGGIGTLAQTLKAGIGHLVVPNSHDQFDNGWRIERLGLGRSIPQTRYDAAPVAAAMRSLLDDAALRQRAARYAEQMDSAGALRRACELIEALVPGAVEPATR